jgi:hypothetical protein
MECYGSLAIDSTPGNSRAVDAIDHFILNPYHVVEIADGMGQRLCVITFSYLDRSTAVPVISGFSV